MSKAKATPFNYSFIPGVSQYSAGVMAAPGYEIVRLRLMSTPALPVAFKQVEDYLENKGLTPQAVCAFEIRSPGQFTEQGFRTFNERYLSTLENWGSLVEGENPVARSNVIPEFGSLAEPGIHAFSYVQVAPENQTGDTFVIAGSAEAPEGQGDYRDHTIALNDESAAGLAMKTDWVIGEMARRLGVFSKGWGDVSDVQVYTTRAYREAQAQLAAMVPTFANIAWHYCNPPVVGLTFEMDCRRTRNEQVLRE